MPQSVLIETAFLIVLIWLSGVFSSSETALTTASRVSLKSLADDGDKNAACALSILGNYSKMLSTILICNNIVNIAASSLVTSMVIRYIGNSAVTVSTLVLTVVILLFGEITPKNISTVHALRMARRYAPVIRFLMKVLTPVIFFIDFLSGRILKLLHVDPNHKTPITENELKTYVEVGHEEGVIERGEKDIIYNVLDFGDSVAKDVMVPRIDMACLPVDATYDEAIALFRRDLFTRIPVYDGSPDQIIGLINIKDFILSTRPEEFHIRAILRPAFYTYEYKKTADLLREMQQRSFNVTFVLNEYGATVGMITTEDLVEEIVGELRDEYDADEKEQIHKYDDRTYLIEGGMKLDDINDAIGSAFDSEDYDSLGGLMIEQLDRLPKNDETVTLENGTTLQAKGIRQNRILKVLVRFKEAPRRDEETREKKGGEAK